MHVNGTITERQQRLNGRRAPGTSLQGHRQLVSAFQLHAPFPLAAAFSASLLIPRRTTGTSCLIAAATKGAGTKLLVYTSTTYSISTPHGPPSIIRVDPTIER